MTSDYATKSDVKAGFDDVLGVLKDMTEQIDSRFSGVENYLGNMQGRLETLEGEVKGQREDIRRIFTYLDSIEKQLEISDQERLVMGHHLERLDKWVHELATKIDYKLSA